MRLGLPIAAPDSPLDFPGGAPYRREPGNSNARLLLPSCVPPLLVTDGRRGRNIDRLSIAYSLGSRLRPA